MKKGRWFLKGSGIRSLVLLFFLITLGLSVSAFGASLDLGEATGTAGIDATIPVTLTTGGLQIAAVAMDIGYDTSLLEDPRVTIGPSGSAAGKQVISSTPSPGVFRIGVLSISNNNAIGDGIVANVTFRIKDTATAGDITLTNTPSASDRSGNPVSIGGSNGTIHAGTCCVAELNLGSTTGAPGGTATIPITLVTNGLSISATSNDLQYNASMLLNPRVVIGPAGTAAEKSVVSNVVTPGLFRIGVLSIQNNNPIGDGVVAYVTFDIDPSVPLLTEILVDNVPNASNPYGNLVPVIGSSGLISVVGLQIGPDSLPPVLQEIHGFTGVQSHWDFSVIGGEAPYSWSIVSGELPNGLSLNPSTGVISGKPLEFGMFPFTVKVVDNNLLEATKDLILSIALLGDANGNGSVAINELQIVINSYLGIYPSKSLGDISMVTPYKNSSDMASINEAFSSSASAPWGFAHNGIDFMPNGNFKPFQAVCSGSVDSLNLWQNEITSNWQAGFRLKFNDMYSVWYVFEPMSAVKSDGEAQLANIVVSIGQNVSQGDIIGYLYTVGNGAHVHWGLVKDEVWICPEPYFTSEARDSILNLLHVVWPGANICY